MVQHKEGILVLTKTKIDSTVPHWGLLSSNLYD